MSSQTRLRSLAKEYANGTLEKDKYRKERTVYLEAVLAGDVAVHLNQSVAVTQDKSDSVTQRKPNSTQSSAETSRPFNSRIILLAGVSVLALVAIIVLVLGSGENDNVTPPVESASNVVTPAPGPVETAPLAAQNLITAFLTNNMWSDTSMDTFLQDWNNLAPTEKTGVSNTVEFSQLTSSILKKLVEERALSTIGNPETSLEKQRELIEFANSIGITDSRISLPQQTIMENL